METIEQIERKYGIIFDANDANYAVSIFNNPTGLHYDFTDSNVLNIFGLYHYHVTKNYEQAIQYYQRAIELENSNAMCNLAGHYKKVGNKEKAVEYYSRAIELGNSPAMNNLACYYEKVGNKEKAVEYYSRAIELGISTAMCNLACYYEKEGNEEKAIEYYVRVIELGELSADHLADYQKVGNEEKIVECYSRAIELGSSNAMCNYLTAITKLTTLSNTYPIQVFNHIQNNDEFKLTSILAKNKKVVAYLNKKRLFTELNYVVECPICYEIKLNIILDCGHRICIDCYPNVHSCYLRCC